MREWRGVRFLKEALQVLAVEVGGEQGLRFPWAKAEVPKGCKQAVTWPQWVQSSGQELQLQSDLASSHVVTHPCRPAPPHAWQEKLLLGRVWGLDLQVLFCFSGMHLGRCPPDTASPRQPPPGRTAQA